MPINEDRKKVIQDSHNNDVIIGNEFLNDQTSIVRSSGGLYCYNSKEGVYALLDELLFNRLFLKFVTDYGIHKLWKSNRRKEVFTFLHASPNVKDVEIDRADNHICLKNGVLNIETKKLFPHSPNYYTTSKIEVDYDKDNTSCPNFMNFLYTTFSNDEETIGNIIRLGGYIMSPSCKAERMFIFDGPGGSGKSTLLNVFRLFFTKEQVTPLSLSEIAGSGFEKELLLKSRLNLSAEEKRSYLEAETIKKIVTSDEMTIRPIYSKAISFKPMVKLILACNGMPKFKDTSDAIYRRLLIIPFENQYKNKFEYETIQYREQRKIFLKDPSMFEKIEKEKSAIFNLFIGGLEALMKENWQFKESRKSTVAMNEYKKNSDSVAEFLNENYKIDFKTEKISLYSIMEDYKKWYDHNVNSYRQPKMRLNELGKRINETFSVPKERGSYITNDGEAVRTFYYPLKKLNEQPFSDISFDADRGEASADKLPGKPDEWTDI